MTPFNNSVKEQLSANQVATIMVRELVLEGIEQTTLENAKFVTMESRLLYKNNKFKLQAFTATVPDRELTVKEVADVIYQGEDSTCYAVTGFADKDITALKFPEELKELATSLIEPVAIAAITEMTYVSNADQLYQAMCIVAKAKDGSVVGLRFAYRSE